MAACLNPAGAGNVPCTAAPAHFKAGRRTHYQRPKYADASREATRSSQGMHGYIANAAPEGSMWISNTDRLQLKSWLFNLIGWKQ